jgi:hypothetical protein
MTSWTVRDKRAHVQLCRLLKLVQLVQQAPADADLVIRLLLLLLSELAGLEDEIQQEESEELPSYLLNAASANKSGAITSPAEKVPAKEVEVDVFGLPDVPMRQLNA